MWDWRSARLASPGVMEKDLAIRRQMKVSDHRETLTAGPVFLLRMRQVHKGQEPGVLMEKEGGASADDKVTNFKENQKKPDVCDLA